MPICPKCGTFVSSDATFCSMCGSPLQPQQPMEPPFPQPTSRPWGTSPTRYGQPIGLSERLEKALGRARLLGFIILGLSVVILLESLYWSGFFG
ncbi:zinc ribbon domain-containing protein [Candidatus Bathyarchaeota archaeon]|nr:zinc ribbon domain-containing protein [Candidatus Bathyarchaeota archaeon]